MKQDQERWLDEKLDQDLAAWADEQERLLMEDEELRDIHMPAGSLEKIHQRLEERRKSAEEAADHASEDTATFSAEEGRASHRSKKSSGRVRVKMLLVLAAALVLVVGAGVVSSGKKLFSPDIQQRERGGEVRTKVENTDSTYTEYDEEEVCQEIQEELGVLPVRFKYRPGRMHLKEYVIDTNNMAIMIYESDEKNIEILISKDYSKSTIAWQTDGESIGSGDTIWINSCSLDVEMHIYEDTDGNRYYNVEFEYLDTYYDIIGMLEEEEFIKLVENIVIKNV